jgi:hypothetical protein
MNLERKAEEEAIGLLFESLKEITKRWKGGLFHSLRTSNPLMYEELKWRESEVNALLIELREGKISIERFKEALNSWIDLLEEILDMEEEETID